MDNKRDLKKELIKLMNDKGFLLTEYLAINKMIENDEILELVCDYIKWVGRYATLSSISSLISGAEDQLGIERDKSYPINKYVIYIGETNSEFNNGDYYPVEVKYPYQHTYEVLNEKDEVKEYDSSLFADMDLKSVIYTGFRDKKKNNNDLEVGKEYKVKKRNSFEIVLDNGIVVGYDDTSPEKYIIKKGKPSKWKTNTFLDAIRIGASFGKTSWMYERMNDETIYYHINHTDKPIIGRDNICDVFQRWFKEDIEKHVFTDSAIATTLDDFSNMFKKGEKCLINYHNDRDPSAIFVRHDGYYIKEIITFHYLPKFKLDFELLDNIEMPVHKNENGKNIINKKYQKELLKSPNFVFGYTIKSLFVYKPSFFELAYDEHNFFDKLLEEHILPVMEEEKVDTSDYKKVSPYFYKRDGKKMIIIETPNPKMEGESNFIAITMTLIKPEIYVSEYYAKENKFKLTSMDRYGRYKQLLMDNIDSIITKEDFINNIPNY